jgi:hypothetical protein
MIRAEPGAMSGQGRSDALVQDRRLDPRADEAQFLSVTPPALSIELDGFAAGSYPNLPTAQVSGQTFQLAH